MGRKSSSAKRKCHKAKPQRVFPPVQPFAVATISGDLPTENTAPSLPPNVAIESLSLSDGESTDSSKKSLPVSIQEQFENLSLSPSDKENSNTRSALILNLGTFVYPAEFRSQYAVIPFADQLEDESGAKLCPPIEEQDRLDVSRLNEKDNGRLTTLRPAIGQLWLGLYGNRNLPEQVMPLLSLWANTLTSLTLKTKLCLHAFGQFCPGGGTRKDECIYRPSMTQLLRSLDDLPALENLSLFLGDIVMLPAPLARKKKSANSGGAKENIPLLPFTILGRLKSFHFDGLIGDTLYDSLRRYASANGALTAIGIRLQGSWSELFDIFAGSPLCGKLIRLIADTEPTVAQMSQIAECFPRLQAVNLPVGDVPGRTISSVVRSLSPLAAHLTYLHLNLEDVSTLLDCASVPALPSVRILTLSYQFCDTAELLASCQTWSVIFPSVAILQLENLSDNPPDKDSILPYLWSSVKVLVHKSKMRGSVSIARL